MKKAQCIISQYGNYTIKALDNMKFIGLHAGAAAFTPGDVTTRVPLSAGTPAAGTPTSSAPASSRAVLRAGAVVVVVPHAAAVVL